MQGRTEESIQNGILQHLADHNQIDDSLDYAKTVALSHVELDKSLKSLLVDDYLALKVIEKKIIELTEEGSQYAQKGTPEYQYASSLEVDVPYNKAEVEAKFEGETGKIGFAKAMTKKWIKLDPSDKNTVIRIEKNLEDTDRKQLSEYLENPDYERIDKKAFDLLKKRKLVNVNTQKSYLVTKGPNFQPERVKLVTDLTADMLRSGAWKDTPFKNYNFNAKGVDPEGGHLHPLLKVRAQFREILLEMGFNEMPTSKFVESSFWNFDTLFQPQSHPARDMHDTFFLKNPTYCKEFPQDYCNRVQEIHEKGGYDSLGYQYEWDITEAKKNLLRTHTTAISSQMLYALAQQKEGFKPMKYFSIDRVFRNETLDATHLAEFHQVEGFIADRNIGLSHLLGILEEFYAKIGIKQLKFKPAYNPYTEPSLEIFGFHPQLKRWVEIGNSGVFRPEMLRPMGLPEDVSVIAWGLSLERPTMIYYGISNIRDLFGHKVPLSSTKEVANCEQRQLSPILNPLGEILLSINEFTDGDLCDLNDEQMPRRGHRLSFIEQRCKQYDRSAKANFMSNNKGSANILHSNGKTETDLSLGVHFKIQQDILNKNKQIPVHGYTPQEGGSWKFQRQEIDDDEIPDDVSESESSSDAMKNQMDNEFILQQSPIVNTLLRENSLNSNSKELELDFVQNEEDMAQKYQEKMKNEQRKKARLSIAKPVKILLIEESKEQIKNRSRESSESSSSSSSSSQSSSSSSMGNDQHRELPKQADLMNQFKSQHHHSRPFENNEREKVAEPDNAVGQCQPADKESIMNNAQQQTFNPKDKKQIVQKKRRVTIIAPKKLITNGVQSCINMQDPITTTKKKVKAKAKGTHDEPQLSLSKLKSQGASKQTVTPGDRSIDGSPFTRKDGEIVSPGLRHQLQSQSLIKIHKIGGDGKKLIKKQQPSIFDQYKHEIPYNEMVMGDKFFKQTYIDNICQAIFIFPQFKRNYSKNYTKVQNSYARTSKKKKTIVFDIDETLVFAAHSQKEIPINALDKTIRIKVSKYGGSAKAYLSFRPYFIEMLIELVQDFEIILYTCGTSEYAKSFSKAVHELFFEKYASQYYHLPPDFNPKDFKFFDHVLSLQQCLYSYENDLYIKDLKILEIGRNLQEVVIVDNNVQSFYLQLTNGIPIYDYEGDKDDRALLSLTNYLKSFLHEEDVRTKINKDFQIMKILEERGTLKQID